MAAGRPPFRVSLNSALLGVLIVLNVVVLGLLLKWSQPEATQTAQSLEPVRASQRTPDSSPSAAPSSTTEASGTPTSSATPPPTAGTASTGLSIALRAGVRQAASFEPVPITGSFPAGGVLGARLEVQRLVNGSWVRFPLPAAVAATGRFQTFVELGSPGRHQLRVVDPETGVASNIVTVTIS